MAQRRITTALVRELQPNKFAWDDHIRGLGVRATGSGLKSYVMMYRNATGKQRVMVLGRCSDWSVSAIRKRATEVRRGIDGGDDPLAERDEIRHSDSMSDIIDTYWEDHCLKKNKTSTQLLNFETLKLIRPAFGKLRLPEVTRKFITDWHHDLQTTSTPHRANAALAILMQIFSLLEEWETIPQGTNPARFVKMHRIDEVDVKTRALDAQQLRRLAAVLGDGTEHIACCACVRMALLTGMRREEVRNLRWEHVDLENAQLRVIEAKAGPRVVFLNQRTVELLSGLSHSSVTEWVFEKDGALLRVGALRNSWRRMKLAADIPGTRFHDLRHTYATWAVGAGVTALQLKLGMGHSDVRTSEKYLTVLQEQAAEAAEKVGDAIGAALD